MQRVRCRAYGSSWFVFFLLDLSLDLSIDKSALGLFHWFCKFLDLCKSRSDWSNFRRFVSSDWSNLRRFFTDGNWTNQNSESDQIAKSGAGPGQRTVSCKVNKGSEATKLTLYINLEYPFIVYTIYNFFNIANII